MQHDNTDRRTTIDGLRTTNVLRRNGVYQVGNWAEGQYQPTYGSLTAEKMQIDEGRNSKRKREAGKEKELPASKRLGFSIELPDPVPDVPEVRLGESDGPSPFERFAPADGGVYSRTGETSGRYTLSYYCSHFDL